MERVERLKALCKDAIRIRTECFPDMFSVYPVLLYVHGIDSMRRLAGYRSLNLHNSYVYSKITSEYSAEGKYVYHQVVLLSFILSSLNKIFEDNYTDFIREQFLSEYDRVVRDMKINELDFYDFTNDLFCKDMAISSLRMYPVGLLKVESCAGIPRRSILSGNGRDLFRWFGLIKRTGALNPYHEIHLDVRYKDEFSPEGWEKALRRVGEMVARNPRVRGITGGSWFFDPRIREVSPHLAYLRQSIEGRGGVFFVNRRDPRITELAISKSKTRRRLFDSGVYNPISYYMVWARHDIMKWI